MIIFAQLDAELRVKWVGRADFLPPEAVVISLEEEATIMGGGDWQFTPGGDLEPAIPTISVALAKDHAIRKIDGEAELARAQYLTVGSGQALEYQQTEAEGRAYKAAGYPTFDANEYPFIAAEINAIYAATGLTISPSDTADTIIAQADAWRSVGSQIKEIRRSAKMKISMATTHAEVKAASQVVWPPFKELTGVSATASVGAVSVTIS